MTKDLICQAPIFFEDDQYLGSKTCSGEWGGTIKFKNKKTGIEYACSATCPVVVNKIDGKYIVTNTLAHIRGSSQVLEISNPSLLNVFKLPKFHKKGNIIYRHVGDEESSSTQGAIQIVDSLGVLTLASFPYEGELYHVITDFHKTFIAKIENHRFVTVDTLSNKSFWTYDPEVIKNEGGHWFVFFTNSEIDGYLDIWNNCITLVQYK